MRRLIPILTISKMAWPRFFSFVTPLLERVFHSEYAIKPLRKQVGKFLAPWILLHRIGIFFTIWLDAWVLFNDVFL